MADQLELFAVRSKARKPRSAKGKTVDPKPQGALGAFPKPEPKNRRAVPLGAPSARLYVFPVARDRKLVATLLERFKGLDRRHGRAGAIRVFEQVQLGKIRSRLTRLGIPGPMVEGEIYDLKLAIHDLAWSLHAAEKNGEVVA